jgi:hypothetical protein
MKQNTCCRIFLLSPAYAGGERARMILRDQATFELARRLRSKRGAPIAEVFTFLSGLYFRGKIAYATAFARPPRGIARRAGHCADARTYRRANANLSR